VIVFAFAQPILADIGELIIGLVALVFLIIRHLLEANKQAAPPRVRPAQVPPALPQQQAKGAAPAAGQQADPLRAQVEEFLRRAGQPQPAQRPPQPAAAGGMDVRPAPSQPTEQRTFGEPLRQAEWRKAPQPAAPADKPRRDRGASKPRRRKSVAEHVAEQVTAHTRSLADKASQLGQRIVAEDQQFDVQLKAKFDHTVGTLAGSVDPAAADPVSPASDTPAAQIAAMLANPGGVRQAVIVNEILRRPSDRW
jgi:hypothetical protein